MFRLNARRSRSAPHARDDQRSGEECQVVGEMSHQYSEEANLHQQDSEGDTHKR